MNRPSPKLLPAILITILLTALATAGSIYIFEHQPVITSKIAEKTPPTQKDNVAETIKPAFEFLENERQTFHNKTTTYAYQLVPIEDQTDQALIKKDRKTNKVEVVYPSIKAAFPELKNWLLNITTAFGDQNKVIFQSYLPESDAPPGLFYSMDLSTYKLSEMKINEVYQGLDALSFMDGKFMAISVPSENPQQMYLLDLEKDSAKNILTLKGNETFSGGESAFFFLHDIKWLSPEKIRFAVFNKKLTTDTTYEDFYKALIEYRELKI